MPQDKPIQGITPGHEHETATGPHATRYVERLVLNGTSGGDDEGALQQFADALLEVVAGARNLSRAEVAELLGTAMDRIDHHPQSVEFDALTDRVLLGSHLGITIQTDDGKVLGHAAGEHAEDN